MFVKWHEMGDDPNPIRRWLRALQRRLGGSNRTDWRPSPEWLALMDEVQAIGPSPLVGVVPVAMTVDAAGVIVDLLAIEVRELGAILYWRARSSREVMLLSAKVSMTDDRGTPYRVTQAGGGGDGHAWQGQTFAVPAPPRRARLGVVLESFGPSADMPLPPHLPTERVPGPWSFDVEVNLA